MARPNRKYVTLEFWQFGLNAIHFLAMRQELKKTTLDHCHRLIRAVLLVILLSGTLASADAGPGLEVRARVGPWPVISRLIGYDGRLWFANSVKGRNHNSADIWSLDPVSGDMRFERHLYSQDAGVPVIHRGLLFWPFEDSRFSLGWGMIEVTNGRDWAPVVIPTAEIFHTHALVAWRGKLLAVTSAWRAGLQVSDDLGRDWKAIYDHPTPELRVSRFLYPVVLGSTLFGYLRGHDGAGLVLFTGKSLEKVPGWPADREVFALKVHNGAIFTAVHGDDGREIWRTNGRTSLLVSDHFANLRLVDLSSDGSRLLAVTANGNGGTLWSSRDGAAWRKETGFSGGQPWSVHVVAGGIYVAGAGDDGRGILWGPKEHRIPRLDTPMPLPRQFSANGGATDWSQLAADLDRALGGISQYENHGRGKLRGLVFKAVTSGAPPGFFARRLSARMPVSSVQTFGNQLTVAAADIGRTMVLWGMGLSAQKGVPPDFITRPWSTPANSFEKYFDPQPAAIWAVSAARQRDSKTIAGLIGRLEHDSSPLWLKAQTVGTLTTLTGQKFAYDAGAWRRWWQSVRQTWAE